MSAGCGTTAFTVAATNSTQPLPHSH
jgi:hypothetical protein